ncbi:MAG: SIMPL domain-containing protein [Alphaproteobacteria bacterium]
MRIAIFSALAMMSSVGIAAAQGLSPHTITVQGQAEVMATPDHASIDMGVVSTAKTVAQAAQDNSALMARWSARWRA